MADLTVPYAAVSAALGAVFFGLVAAVKLLWDENKRLNQDARDDARVISIARQRIEAGRGVRSEYPSNEEEDTKVRNAKKLVNREWIEKTPDVDGRYRRKL
jgi:hypothetical protein